MSPALEGVAYVPHGVKPGARVKVIKRPCGCIRFRINGFPRKGPRCKTHGPFLGRLAFWRKGA